MTIVGLGRVSRFTVVVSPIVVVAVGAGSDVAGGVPGLTVGPADVVVGSILVVTNVSPLEMTGGSNWLPKPARSPSVGERRTYTRWSIR